jgi:hypothetical protein
MTIMKGILIFFAMFATFLGGAAIQRLASEANIKIQQEQVVLSLPKNSKELNRRILFNSIEKITLDELKKLEKERKFPWASDK